MIVRDIVLLLGISFCGIVFSADAPSALAPFGKDVKADRARAIKPTTTASQPIECLSGANAAAWKVQAPPAKSSARLFAIEQREGKPVLNIAAGELEPGKSSIMLLLPGDGPANGDIWQKNHANYISFQCKSNRPVAMTFHLLQRGKSTGTYRAGFSATPGEWQRVILPIQQFGLQTFARVAGMAIRTASASPEKSTEVLLSDITVGGMPYSDVSWKSRAFSASLKGDWRFATEANDAGVKQGWQEPTFDDSKWQLLKSGQTWEEQGITHYGWGWYRQQIFVPKEFAGVPLKLTLCAIPSDDDVWFNGQHIGGISGQYQYKNFATRSYTVPPAAVRYGENNTIAIRIWGGDIGFVGAKSGLTKGPLIAELDPYCILMREPGGQPVAAELFDLSDARQGKPFQMIFPFPADVAPAGAQLSYRIADRLGNEIQSGQLPLTRTDADQAAQALVNIDRQAAQTIYLRGRLEISLMIQDPAGAPLYASTRVLDQLSFAKRDNTPLPELPARVEDTPYGNLKLVDEVDCATSLFDDPHPYLQSGFNGEQNWMTPGSPVDVHVTEILGKKARESGYGWFGYRVGRGKLKPHTCYLLRVEYPEDKPRYCPMGVHVGQNFVDSGWKNGLAPDDVYDNWPLSNSWQWYDTIVPLDDQTVGTGGTESASAVNGFWVYFLNKLNGQFFAMYAGGPAISRIKLYEIDSTANAPAIRLPQGLPHRVLAFDTEREANYRPADLVQYAKLMGYNAISPVIIKWGIQNWGEPLNGYTTINVDARDYWVKKPYDPASHKDAAAPVPGRPSPHLNHLQATRGSGIDYIPRIEWGGSLDLPREAVATDPTGKPAAPTRFANTGPCTNLLHPAAWDDLQSLIDHMIKPYARDNPQLTGIHWRIRGQRLPISYGQADIELFAKETGTPLPAGSLTGWATGAMKQRYEDWWHQKRAAFHIKLAELLKSYRPDMTLYYYNWDPDKFGILLPDLTAWGGVIGKAARLDPAGARSAYEQERQERQRHTAADFIEAMRTGNFGQGFYGLERADLGIRPDLYRQTKGIQIFAPAPYLCYANKPGYLNYFQTADGLAASHAVSYDEVGARSINPKFSGNMITPAGGSFSMALELLAYLHGDARTLNYTTYTYGRGFADAHRRFAQAFLALPAIPGTVIDQADGDPDLKVRIYPSANGTYVGVAFKGYAATKLTVSLPSPATAGTRLTDLVTNRIVPLNVAGDKMRFELDSGPMELHAFLIAQ